MHTNINYAFALLQIQPCNKDYTNQSYFNLNYFIMKLTITFSRFLALCCLLLSITPSVWADAVQVGQLYYNIDSDSKTASVARHSDYKEYTQVDIPGTITVDGTQYAVTSVGQQAFQQCDKLTAVNIGEGITEICMWGFVQCKGMEQLNLPNSLTTVRESAFSGCTGLKSLTLPDNLETIEAYGFGKLNITELTIGANTTQISSAAFNSCSYLQKINFNEKLEKIGSNAFYGCAVKELLLPKSLKEIGAGAFSNCMKLETVTAQEPLAKIDDQAFYKCSALKTIALPNTLTSIGHAAFYECINLDGLILPESLKELGPTSLYGCISLKSIKIPNSVTVVNSGTFYNCTGLTELSFHDGITEIGHSAIYGCSNLNSVKLPAGLTKLSHDLFNKCTSLEVINLPASIEYIDENAFYGCSALKNIDISDKVNFIGNGFVIGCTSLTSINVAPGNSMYTDIDGVLFNKEKTKLLAYPSGIKGEYTVPESTLKIDDYVFNANSNITGIHFPKTLKVIGMSNFYGCNSLTTVRLPEQLDSLGATCFFFNRSVTSIIMPNNNVWIGNNALSATGITTMLFPESIKEIGVDNSKNEYYSVLGSCSALTSLSLPSTLEKLNPIASYCSAIEAIYCFAAVPPVLVGENAVDIAATVRVPKGTAEAYASAWASLYPNLKYEDVLPGAATVTVNNNKATLNWESYSDNIYTGTPVRYTVALYEGENEDRTLISETRLDANGNAGGSAVKPENNVHNYEFTGISNKTYSYELKGYTALDELSMLHKGSFGMESSGIDNIEDNNAEIISQEYYDLSGRKIAKPENGLYVVRTIKADGTVSVSKQQF